MIIAIFSIITLVVLTSLAVELRRDLMMLQQNSYRNERYLRWLKASQDSTSVVRLLSVIVVLLGLSKFSNEFVVMIMMLALASYVVITLARRKYKKPLVMTARAKRIYTVQILLSLIVIAATVLIAGCDFTAGGLSHSLFVVALTAMALYFLSHPVTLAANTVLAPVEKSINMGYYRDAERILRSMPSLKIIGITGSYGKTSTKHYLHRILSEKYDTLMTPGSYNTTLGVVRTVREYLKPYNEVFIVEMGAKQPGDIKEICDLVRPEIGIITAVGEQHLESFKSIENVQRTKFELADALPAGGLAVINNDFEYIANRPVANVEAVRYGVGEESVADYRVTDIEYDASGTRFAVIAPDGNRMEFNTRLVGECNVSNLTAAIIVALHLDVELDKIRYAVEKIEQVEHRLQVKRTPAGVTILDDAFNSNPHGSSMALDVLSSMKGGRRIIITPGMIELGERQYELNRKFGEKIGRSADVAIIVGEYNREAISEGLDSTAPEGMVIHKTATFAEAQQLLSGFIAAGDTVLYENDLPDTFK